MNWKELESYAIQKGWQFKKHAITKAATRTFLQNKQKE